MAMVTITVIHDNEKPDYTKRCLDLLYSYQDMSQFQVIVINQTQQSFEYKNIEIYDEIQPFPGLWNTMSCLAELRPRMQGQWWLQLHNEFIPEPGALNRALEQLKDCPIYLGSLYRLGSENTHPVQHSIEAKYLSLEWLRYLEIQHGINYKLPKTYWSGQTNNQIWTEDIFFANLDWIDRIGFLSYTENMYFQDVYDLIGIVCHSRQTQCLRLHDVEFCHLWHPKGYNWLTDEIIEWFDGQSDAMTGTLFTKTKLLELRDYLNNPNGTNKKAKFRVGVGGTVERYKRIVL